MTAQSQAVIISYSSKTCNKRNSEITVAAPRDFDRLMVETDSSPPITAQFGGPGRAIGRERTCVRLCVWTITFEANVL